MHARQKLFAGNRNNVKYFKQKVFNTGNLVNKKNVGRSRKQASGWPP